MSKLGHNDKDASKSPGSPGLADLGTDLGDDLLDDVAGGMRRHGNGPLGAPGARLDDVDPGDPTPIPPV